MVANIPACKVGTEINGRDSVIWMVMVGGSWFGANNFGFAYEIGSVS